MRLGRLTLVPFVLGIVACGGEDPQQFNPNPVDDAGNPVDDAGNPIVDDAGKPIGKDGGTPTPDAGPPPVTGTPLVQNLTITEVAVFQTVKIGVMKAGAAVTAKPPVVADRAALVRVYVAPQAGYSAHAIQAQLTLQSGSGKTTYPVDVTPSATSTEATLASTINFSVPQGVIKPDTTYSVALREKTGTSGPASGPAQWPADGSLTTLGAVSTGPQLKIVVVPIQYNADGSGRLPDTSPTQIQRYKDILGALYPTPQVDVSVHAAVPISFSISGSGSGINTLLNTVLQVRAQDKPASDVYYWGAVAPAASFNAYCSGGCVTGLSPLVTNPNDSASRASVGIGFTGDDSIYTAAHEIGHAHGRNHAPCGGASGTDPGYPYAGGSVGSWGYNRITNTLIDPAKYKDIMSYCNPDWWSDYNYGAILTRVKTVNGAQVVFGPPTSYHFGTVDEAGTIAWTGDATLDVTPGGEARTVEYLDANGHVIATKTGYYYAYDHLPGGTLMAPTVPGAVKTRLGSVAGTGAVRALGQ